MIKIIGKLFLGGIGFISKRGEENIREDCNRIKQELEDHLQAINENTNEISANYEYINSIERKIDRIIERIDEIQMSHEVRPAETIFKDNFDVKRLNKREQEVFLVIYTSEEEMGSITYRDIAERLRISEQLAGAYVTSLIEKGVPILKKYINSVPFLHLDPEFKTLQTKQNILQLSLQEFGF